MAPRLRVSAGPSVDRLSLVRVNDEDHPLDISSDEFEGRATVRIQGFTGVRPKAGSGGEGESTSDSSSDAAHESAAGLATGYFDHSYARGCTWSIQVQGRFKREAVSVDDVEFGNQFDKPIRDRLPWGTSVALRAINILDPNLRHDVYCDTPWAFGPMITSMSRVNVKRLADADKASAGGDDGEGSTRYVNWPAFPHGRDENDFTQDDTSVLLCTPGDSSNAVSREMEEGGLADVGTLGQLRDPAQTPHTQRARFWSNRAARQAASWQPTDVFTLAFDNGFIDFNTLRAVLPYTGGMGFDLQQYWDGQPVRYVCKNSRTDIVFFVIEFQIVEKDA